MLKGCRESADEIFATAESVGYWNRHLSFFCCVSFLWFEEAVYYSFLIFFVDFWIRNLFEEYYPEFRSE